MAERPYVVLSCAVSLDGYLDDATGDRLVLSNAEDLDRVDELRSSCDAILVGANTIRRDDPRLVIRSEQRRIRRAARGMPPDPIKVTMTESGELPVESQFFSAGKAAKLVYCPQPRHGDLRARLGDRAEVVATGVVATGVVATGVVATGVVATGVVATSGAARIPDVLADLAGRGVRRVLVEGGGAVLTGFLAGAHANELQLVIAPFLVGDPQAPRFVGAGRFPFGPGRPLKLTGTRQLGDLVLLRYVFPALVEK
jgi:5-amino-6-(5-phosphoribosylamino)uracil reductase